LPILGKKILTQPVIAVLVACVNRFGKLEC